MTIGYPSMMKPSEDIVSELSRVTGCPAERIRVYAEAELFGKRAPDIRDAMAVRLIDSLEAAGIELARLSDAIRHGHLTFDFTRSMVAFPVLMSGETYGDVIERLGVEEELARETFIAARLPRFDADKLARQDETRFLASVAEGKNGGLSPKAMTRYLRVVSQSLRRIVEAQTELFYTEIEEPLLRLNLPPGEHLRTVASRRRPLQKVGLDSTEALLLRIMESVVFESVATRLQNAFADERTAQRHVRAVAFADLTGFTDFTKTHGDTAGAELAGEFDELAHEAVWSTSGRIVKTLGDGVLLLYGEPEEALPSLVKIRDLVSRWNRLPVHFGLAAGQVIVRDGDIFGTTVNRASHLSELSASWQILADEDIRNLPTGVPGNWVAVPVKSDNIIGADHGFRWQQPGENEA